MDPGLCASCANARVVRGARSTFWSCELSRRDARYPRYPALPVLSCAGWKPGEPRRDARDPPAPGYFFEAW
jgi:hypothetical protein